MAGELLELGARELDVQVLRPCRVGRDEGEIDLCLACRRQLALGLLSRLAQALHGELVLRQVDRLLLLKLVLEPVEQHDIKVLAAEQRVAVGRLHLEDAAGDLKDRHIKGAATEVVHGHHLAVLLVEAVRERGRGGLVDDAQHLEPRDLASVLGCLPLRVVEVCGHRHHRVRHRTAKVGLRCLLHLAEHEGARLRRRVLLPIHLHPRVAAGAAHDAVRARGKVLLDVAVLKAPPDQALGREERPFRIRDCLALGGRAHEACAVVHEGDDRRRRALALSIFDHLRSATLHDRDARVGRPQIDADHVADGAGGHRSREGLLQSGGACAGEPAQAGRRSCNQLREHLDRRRVTRNVTRSSRPRR